MTPLDFVPLAVQIAFALASVFKFRAVYAAGTANEQSVGAFLLMLAGHAALGAWALFYAHSDAIVMAAMFGFVSTLPLLTLVLFLRDVEQVTE